MKRWTALMAVLLLLCPIGCYPGEASVPFETEFSAPLPPLSLAVEQGMAVDAQNAVETFAARVEQLSGGMMSVEIHEYEDPLAALDQGSDLLFASNEEIARANGDFAAYTSPFYFRNYRHLSLSLNSEEFEQITGATTESLLGARSLGAFYGGSSVLVTARPEPLDRMTAFDGIKIYIQENNALEYVVNRLGTRVDPLLKGEEERIQGFNEGRYSAIDCSTLSLDRLNIPARREMIGITDSFHLAQVNWLMLSCDTDAELSERQRAVLTEAASYALAQNDEAVLAQEQKGISHLEELGCPIFEFDYDEIAPRTAEILEPSKYAPWNWETYYAVQELANT